MEVTEYDRHQLFVWFEERMGPERAATMMNLIPPIGWFELASKHDLLELEGRLTNQLDGKLAQVDGKLAQVDGKLAQLEARLMRGFITWLLASQATVVTVMVGLFLAGR